MLNLLRSRICSTNTLHKYKLYFYQQNINLTDLMLASLRRIDSQESHAVDHRVLVGDFKFPPRVEENVISSLRAALAE